MQTRNWTYVKFLFPNVKALDESVSALGESPDFALMRLEQPWFFLRYVDYYGPQLRLRVLAKPGERLRFVDWSQSWYSDLIDTLEAGDAAAPGGPVPGRLGFDVSPYRPEVTKYGSMACVGRVEDLWMQQCEQMIGFWSAPFNKSTRIAVFAEVAREVMQDLDLVSTGAAAYRTHAWYWLRTMNPVQTVAQKFIAQVRRTLAAPLVGEHSAGPKALSGGIVEATGELTSLPESRLAAHYAFNLLHILANRLGLAPIEEGLVMLALAEDLEQLQLAGPLGREVVQA